MQTRALDRLISLLPVVGGILAVFVGRSIASSPFSLSHPVVLGAGGVFLGLVMLRPELGLLTLLATYWLRPTFEGDVLTFTLNRGLGMIVVVGFLARKAIRRDETPLIIDRFDHLCWGLFLTIVFSIVVNGFYPRTIEAVYDLLMGYLVYYWLTGNVLDSWQKLRTALMVVVGCVLVMDLYTVVTALTLPDLMMVKRFEAVEVWDTGFVGQSSFLAIIIVLWLSEGLHGRRKFFLYVLIPLFSTAMFLSGNRSGPIALAISVLFLTAISWKSGRRRSLSLIISVAILLAGTAVLVSAIAPLTVQRALDFNIADYLAPNMSSNNPRFFLIQAAWQMFLDHPILGTGFGSFAHFIKVYATPSWGKTAHNVFMGTLAETGLIGAAVLLFMYREAFRNLWRARIVASTEQGKRAATYALVLLVGLNVVNAMFHGKYINRVMFVVFAFGMVVARLAHRPLKGSQENLNGTKQKQ